MYVCLCKGITDGQIRAAVESGATMRDIRDQLGVMTECGKCACITRDIVKASSSQNNKEVLWVAA